MQSFLKEDFCFVLLDVCLIDLGFGHPTGEVYEAVILTLVLGDSR